MAHTRAPAEGKTDPSSAYAWTFKNPGCMAHTTRVCVAVWIRLRRP